MQGLSKKQQKQFKSILPYRQRSMAQLKLTKKPTGHRIKLVPSKTYSQNVGQTDYRSTERIFQKTSKQITSHPLFQKLITEIGNIIQEIESDFQILKINFHQISVVARKDSLGEGSPEGIHQDGADYIVSALVIERSSVVGGESIIYGPDKKTEYLRTILQPGQGLFQIDKKSSLWHNVTPIYLDNQVGTDLGRRSIFGFDIIVIK